MSVKIEKKKRVYFSQDFNAEEWGQLEKVLQEMEAMEILSAADLVVLIEKYSELSDILEEVGGWHTIRMTQVADDAELAKIQADFHEYIVAPAQPYFFNLGKKIFENDFFASLPEEKYGHLRKILQNEIEIYRDKNIALGVKENVLISKYGEMYSQLTVEFEGQEKTLQEMNLVLKDKDRDKREKAWRLVADKMLEKKSGFEQLFDDMKFLRSEMATNAGFDNYRDYAHQALGRFDYSPQDLLEFHDSIREVVLPVMKEIDERRRQQLGVDALRPWDMSVDLDGKALKPFSDTKDLLAGAIKILGKVDPLFADILSAMSEEKLLDLDNRKGKAPGGYSYPLSETGASFIFMNAVGIQRDVETILHESGHALHAFYMRDEKILGYKDYPSEVAELASMSMELFSLDYLDEFYKDSEDLKKAKREQLESAISIFPAVAVIDAFQHWIYLQKECGEKERDKKFAELKDIFGTGVDWSGLEAEKSTGWLRVLHIFEVPFYYIEYAMAQLGAIALYKQYKEDPQRAIANYKNFMKAGYSKSVPEIYAAAGIKFDFSREYLRELVDFIAAELEGLE